MTKTKWMFSGLLFAAVGAGMVTGCERGAERTNREIRQESREARQDTREARTEMGEHGRIARDEAVTAARGGGPAVMPATAVNSIAEARCAREARCNNVGAGKRYTSRSACLSTLRADRRDDLNLSDCPAGVDQRELSECLREVRDEDCNNPLDTLGRLAACRSSDMCLHAPASTNH